MVNRVQHDNLKHIYLDMDGVLCDFITTFRRIAGEHNITENDKTPEQRYDFHEAIMKHDLFRILKPMKDMDMLLDRVYQYCYENTHVSMSVLTALGTSDPEVCKEVKKQKQDWLLANGIYLVPNFVEKSKYKARYATENHLLIDDNKEKCILPFRDKGGQVIHHRNAETTIEYFDVKGQLSPFYIGASCLRTE